MTSSWHRHPKPSMKNITWFYRLLYSIIFLPKAESKRTVCLDGNWILCSHQARPKTSIFKINYGFLALIDRLPSRRICSTHRLPTDCTRRCCRSRSPAPSCSRLALRAARSSSVGSIPAAIDRGSVASEKAGRERRKTASERRIGRSRWFGQTAEDAFIAAYVHKQNARGDSRHPHSSQTVDK